MLQLIKLTTEEQFKSLKKGDCIIVKWSDYTIKHGQGIKKVKMYNIYENKTNESHTEIICQKRYNHYFNWKRYLEGLGGAEEVYIVQDEPEPAKVSNIGRRVNIKEPFTYYYSGEHIDMPANMEGVIIYDEDNLGKTLIQFNDTIHFDRDGRSNHIFLESREFDIIKTYKEVMELAQRAKEKQDWEGYIDAFPVKCPITGRRRSELYLIDENVVYLTNPAYDAYDAYTLPVYNAKTKEFTYIHYDMDDEFCLELDDLRERENFEQIKEFYGIEED